MIWKLKLLLTYINPLWKLKRQHSYFVDGSELVENWSAATPTRSITHNCVQYIWEFRL